MTGQAVARDTSGNLSPYILNQYTQSLARVFCDRQIVTMKVLPDGRRMLCREGTLSARKVNDIVIEALFNALQKEGKRTTLSLEQLKEKAAVLLNFNEEKLSSVEEIAGYFDALISLTTNLVDNLADDKKSALISTVKEMKTLLGAMQEKVNNKNELLSNKDIQQLFNKASELQGEIELTILPKVKEQLEALLTDIKDPLSKLERERLIVGIIAGIVGIIGFGVFMFTFIMMANGFCYQNVGRGIGMGLLLLSGFATMMGVPALGFIYKETESSLKKNLKDNLERVIPELPSSSSNTEIPQERLYPKV